MKKNKIYIKSEVQTATQPIKALKFIAIQLNAKSQNI